MKRSKKLAVLLLSTLLVGNSLVGVYAEENIKVVVDGKTISFTDTKPYTDENSRTLVPLAFVADALGAVVKWDADSWKVTIQKGETKMALLIGSKRVEMNGKIITMDTAPVLKNERTMVPLAFISQCLNSEVIWDEATSTVNIKQIKAVPEEKAKAETKTDASKTETETPPEKTTTEIPTN